MNACCRYAHYYFGCRFRFTWPDGQYVEDDLDMLLKWKSVSGENIADNKLPEEAGKWPNSFDIDNIEKDGNFQLILKHQSDMSKREMREYKNLCKNIIDSNGKISRIVDTPSSLDYVFKKYIDVFDLIEDGYAIDVKTTT